MTEASKEKPRTKSSVLASQPSSSKISGVSASHLMKNGCTI